MATAKLVNSDPLYVGTTLTISMDDVRPYDYMWDVVAEFYVFSGGSYISYSSYPSQTIVQRSNITAGITFTVPANLPDPIFMQLLTVNYDSSGTESGWSRYPLPRYYMVSAQPKPEIHEGFCTVTKKQVTGDPFTAFVHGLSTAVFTLTINTSTIELPSGVQIASIWINAFGQSHQVTNMSTPTELPVYGDGSMPWTVIVTDTNGQSGTYTDSVTVYPYSPPRLESVTAKRCDSSGDESDTGAYVSYVFGQTTYSSVNGENEIEEYWMSYKATGSTAYVDVQLQSYQGLIDLQLDPGTIYDLIFWCVDTAGEESNRVSNTIMAERYALHIKDGGKAMSIGNVASSLPDENLLVAWDTTITGDLIISSKPNDRNGYLTIGSTTLTEAQLQALLALI